MEKRVPHFVLAKIQEILRDPARRIITSTAHRTAVACGFAGAREIATVVQSLCPKEFYKSMTVHASNKIWQDVYRATREHPYCPDSCLNLYIKLQINQECNAVVVSFKADTGDC
jgi:motility quorum-sensing regulator / GCU-specific mRNA interferase toxin